MKYVFTFAVFFGIGALVAACNPPREGTVTPTAYLDQTTGTTRDERCVGYRAATGASDNALVTIVRAGTNIICPPESD